MKKHDTAFTNSPYHGDSAHGQRTRHGHAHILGDFATGMRNASTPTAIGDFATGMRTTSTQPVTGDFATGMRAAPASVIRSHDFASERSAVAIAV